MELAQNNIFNEARLRDKRDTINQASGAVEKQSLSDSLPGLQPRKLRI